jgi:ubiquinone/menaquinone biosynthesis C-methylase UbiE
MKAKRFYEDYLADNELSPLSEELIKLIKKEKPVAILEFGAGTGKHLAQFPNNVKTLGVDVSLINIIHANVKNKQNYFALGDEDFLTRLYNFDVVFTCSVLDHIEDVNYIIHEFKRIAKVVFLAETNDTPAPLYFPHKYESYGFKKLDFEWKSTGDGATYNIWKYVRN